MDATTRVELSAMSARAVMALAEIALRLSGWRKVRVLRFWARWVDPRTGRRHTFERAMQIDAERIRAARESD